MTSNRTTITQVWMGLAIAFALGVGGCTQRETVSPVTLPLATSAPPVSVELASIRHLSYPTDRKFISPGDLSGAFQSTASGQFESGLYGSVRTKQFGKKLAASFHEGIDIAALNRDRGGHPLDVVYAAADGVVAYCNRIAGNSNYGKYIVLLHDSTAGQVYTLYAHLSQIALSVRVGQPIKAGTVLGVMGNTSSSPIPMARAHLHFEVGLIANSAYDRWYRAKKMTPDHGNFNGGNLVGIDPLAVFRTQQENPKFCFTTYVGALSRAFEVTLVAPHTLDFFRRYPALWGGPTYNGRAMTIAMSDNGLPLRGWNASEVEVSDLKKKKWRVQNVDDDVLGRNGAHLIVRRRDAWTLTAGGERWLEILTYP